MAKRPALGKGIGALLNSAVQEGGKKYFQCPIEELLPHSNQPRKNFNEASLAELTASIKEKGVIQPLVVRRVGEHYQIIAGERRWRAAQRAGLDKLPVVIQDVSEDSALEIALIENIQREDLNPLEEAEAYQNLIKVFDLSQEEVAKRVGKERPTITNALRLLKLPASIREKLLVGQLSMGHARAILSLDDDEDMVEAARQVMARKLSVRDTEKLVKKIKNFTGAASIKKPVPPPDPNLDALISSLTQYLGAQTRIAPRSDGRGGKLEINYQSLDELDRILERIGLAT
ncbi:MAG: ParB/RepB/Spo0J family partition protein [Deltaproteobacteria bacterium]|nr:ParB/RepB/Spo0J family partition protein [Deltaproteobacteria bacterium]